MLTADLVARDIARLFGGSVWKATRNGIVAHNHGSLPCPAAAAARPTILGGPSFDCADCDSDAGMVLARMTERGEVPTNGGVAASAAYQALVDVRRAERAREGRATNPGRVLGTAKWAAPIRDRGLDGAALALIRVAGSRRAPRTLDTVEVVVEPGVVAAVPADVTWKGAPSSSTDRGSALQAANEALRAAKPDFHERNVAAPMAVRCLTASTVEFGPGTEADLESPIDPDALRRVRLVSDLARAATENAAAAKQSPGPEERDALRAAALILQDIGSDSDAASFGLFCDPDVMDAAIRRAVIAATGGYHPAIAARVRGLLAAAISRPTSVA